MDHARAPSRRSHVDEVACGLDRSVGRPRERLGHARNVGSRLRALMASDAGSRLAWTHVAERGLVNDEPLVLVEEVEVDRRVRRHFDVKRSVVFDGYRGEDARPEAAVRVHRYAELLAGDDARVSNAGAIEVEVALEDGED